MLYLSALQLNLELLSRDITQLMLGLGVTPLLYLSVLQHSLELLSRHTAIVRVGDTPLL